MVCDRQVHAGLVSRILVIAATLRIQIGCDIKGVADVEGNLLIFGGMIDGILPNKLEGSIRLVLLEHAEGAFGQCDPEIVFL